MRIIEKLKEFRDDKMIDIITEINLKHSVLISVYPISKRDFSKYYTSPNRAKR